MFGFLPCVLRFCATMLDAVIVLAEVASLHDFVEEELTFFLIRLADEILVRHGEDCLEYVHHCRCKPLHTEAGKCMQYLGNGSHGHSHTFSPLCHALRAICE